MHTVKKFRAGKWLALLLPMLLIACSPKVGSDEWCHDMKNKPAGDWSANEAADFTKHCIFK